MEFQLLEQFWAWVKSGTFHWELKVEILLLIECKFLLNRRYHRCKGNANCLCADHKQKESVLETWVKNHAFFTDKRLFKTGKIYIISKSDKRRKDDQVMPLHMMLQPCT